MHILKHIFRFQRVKWLRCCLQRQYSEWGATLHMVDPSSVPSMFLLSTANDPWVLTLKPGSPQVCHFPRPSTCLICGWSCFNPPHCNMMPWALFGVIKLPSSIQTQNKYILGRIWQCLEINPSSLLRGTCGVMNQIQAKYIYAEYLFTLWAISVALKIFLKLI